MARDLSATAIHYCVTPVNPEAHLLQVVLSLTQPDPAGQQLQLPAWIPGSYMIRDFARHIITLTATAAGEPVAVTKSDKQRWICAPVTAPLVVVYTVYAFDRSVRGAHLDPSHGYFNGAVLLLEVIGQSHQPHTLTLEPPPRPYAATWQVATTLTQQQGAAWQFGTFTAADYAELIDHPVEMGSFTRLEFSVANTPHAVTITGTHDADLERLKTDLTAIIESAVALFGELPFHRYLFQLTVVGSGYGGLEHRSSTSLIASRTDLPWHGMAALKSLPDGYVQLLGLCAHEYLHSWLVKRIQPAEFIAPDLSREVYTTLLWLFEGFTAYYDDLLLVRSGCIDRDRYFKLLSQTISRVMQGSGRLKQSLAESSFEAWTKFYKADENSSNAIVSYYTKGSLFALALDLTLRQSSEGGHSLDSVLRYLWHHYGQPQQGLTEAAFMGAVTAATGVDQTAQWRGWLHQPTDLPLDPLLRGCGIKLHRYPLTSHSDNGGHQDDEANRLINWIGIRIASDDPLRIGVVLEDSPAQYAGLSVGDRLLALNGLELTRSNWEQRLNRLPPHSTATVTLFREEQLLQLAVTLTPPPSTAFRLELAPTLTPAEQLQLTAWLTDSTPLDHDP